MNYKLEFLEWYVYSSVLHVRDGGKSCKNFLPQMDPMDFKSLQLDDQLDLPELKEEPLLTETRKRFVLFPIQYNNVYFHNIDLGAL